MTGDTMSGNLVVNATPVSKKGLVTFNNTAGGETYFYLQSAGTSYGAFTSNHPSYGTAIFDNTSSRYLGITASGVPHFQGNTLLHAGNYTTYTVTKTGGGASGTWPISITGSAKILAQQDTRGTNTAPFAGGKGLHYHFKLNATDGLNDGDMYHSVLQFNQWDEQSGGLCKQLALTDAGNMWFRNASSSTAWGAWKKLLDSSNYASILDGRYVNVSGDTMTGLLTVKTEAYHTGIKLSNTYLTAISGDVIFQNNNSLRFGSDTWDYNQWAGLKYNHSSKYIYLGLADGSIFAANSAQSGGSIITPGISNIFVGNNTTNKVWHAGNDGSGSGLDADLLDGVQGSHYLRSFWTSSPGYNANTYPSGSFCTFTYSNNAPYTGVLAYLGTNYGIYLNLAYNTGTTTGQIAYRKVSPANDGGGLGSWCHLARTIDNVASATKLQTARSLWGNTFDGTQNLTGRLTAAGMTCGYSNTSYAIAGGTRRRIMEGGT